MVLLAFLLVKYASAGCLKTTEAKSTICWAICRTEGFDTGYFEARNDSCICGQRRRFKEITEKSLRIVPKNKPYDPYDEE